jgi:sodium-dependent dicarboxylate transporter 2/3/5
MKKVGLFLGPLLCILLLLLPVPDGLSTNAWRILALAALMLAWWITEAVPIFVTALLPMVLTPLLQVADMKTAAAPYANPVVFLFMGGFMLALAMERWNLHRRIALNLVRLTGTNANGIILGFMIATAFLSMWISNTATTVMMLPIALSVVDLLTRKGERRPMSPGQRAFAVSLMLGIAYAANIGGTATIIGTPPNVVFAGFIRDTYGFEVSFAQWMALGLPFAVFLLAITYLVLVQVLFRNGLDRFADARDLIGEELAALGPMGKGEARTLAVFIVTALAWIFRAQLNQLLGLDAGAGDITLSDHMIAVLASILLFVVPENWTDNRFLLQWRDTEKLPWGILLLFGGGLSLAASLEAVGIIGLIGDQFANLQTIGFWIILGLTAVSLFMTEVMSNVALVTVLLPVVGGIAVGLDMEPLFFCIPVTLAASCAFMLPMSTPPNAIVFASGHLRILQMARAGLILNIITIMCIALLTQYVLPLIFEY